MLNVIMLSLAFLLLSDYHYVSVIVLIVVMQNFIAPNVVVLNVVAP
jgi:hypothetical protein